MMEKKHLKTKKPSSVWLYFHINVNFFTFSVRKETFCPSSNPNKVESLKQYQLLFLWNETFIGHRSALQSSCCISLSVFHSVSLIIFNSTHCACGSLDWSLQTDNSVCCKPVARINVGIGHFCKLPICWNHQGGNVFTRVSLFVCWLVGPSAG